MKQEISLRTPHMKINSISSEQKTVPEHLGIYSTSRVMKKSYGIYSWKRFDLHDPDWRQLYKCEMTWIVVRPSNISRHLLDLLETKHHTLAWSPRMNMNTCNFRWWTPVWLSSHLLAFVVWIHVWHQGYHATGQGVKNTDKAWADWSRSVGLRRHCSPSHHSRIIWVDNYHHKISKTFVELIKPGLVIQLGLMFKTFVQGDWSGSNSLIN